MKYTIKQFVTDCKSVGWYEGKVPPAWMDILDLHVEKKDLESVLLYQSDKNAIKTVMDCRISEDGIQFSIEYMGHTMGRGLVNNKKDLMCYLKVTGYNNGFIPKR